MTIALGILGEDCIVEKSAPRVRRERCAQGAFHLGGPGVALLTEREEDVVRLVADGMKNRAIAQKLEVTEHSIRNYLYRIFEKLGVSTRVELLLYVFSQRGRTN